MFRTRFALLVALLLVLVAPTAHAQFLGAEPLTFTIDPEFPRPYETVTVVPQSTLIDLAASQISVSANGTVVWKGSGSQQVSIQAGAPGQKLVIKITATVGGQTYTKETTIQPEEVALIEEPLTTTHPFYQGAALVTSESHLRLVAMPDLRTSANVRIPAESLVYTWKKDDQILQSSSGIGKSVLVATAPPRYRDARVTVTVSDVNNTVAAETTVLVSPTTPVMRVYSNDPLLGPWFDGALSGAYTMQGTEATFRAVPYFFGNLPTLAWTVSGSKSGSDKDITVRSTGSGKGTASVSVSGTDAAFGQSALSSLSISFGNGKPGLGIFGL